MTPEPGTGKGPRRTSGLRVQILLGLGLVTTFAVIVSGYLALWMAGESLSAQRESSALSLGAAASAVAASALKAGLPLGGAANRAALGGVLSFLTERGDLGVSIIAPDGTPVISRPGRLAGDRDPPVLHAVLAGAAPKLHYRQREGGGLELLVYAPINQGAGVAGAVRLALPSDPPIIAVFRQNRFSSWGLLGFAAGAAALVLAFGSFVLTQFVVRPLQAVERAASRVSAGDLTHRLSTDGPREIASLAEAFNHMTASVADQREQLIRSEKLASVGQLAAGVAHEIGNPLAAVLGYVDILRADAAGEGTGGMSRQDRRDALERVKTETQRINRIIQDLLAYSRPAHEEAAATDLGQILETAEELLRPQKRFRGVRIVRETPAPWPAVMVSPGRLTQVLVNLLINGADAMGGEGRIGIAVSREGPGVRVTISDEGPGVSPELRRKIFDPFFTTKAPGDGTGLGLPICRSIVETYGGTIEIEPTPAGERGARFALTLPAA